MLIRVLCTCSDPTNFLFLKTGLLKLSEVFDLQVHEVCFKKYFMLTTVVLHKFVVIFLRVNFVTETPTQLWQISFKYLGPNFWSSIKK